MVQPEKRLLWHPRQDNKFVVGGGSQITLYEWAPDHPEIRQVTSQHDLSHMKCFAWSPDPAFEDLIAIGQSTGKIDLLRLESSKHAQRNVLTSGPSASLPIRSSRSCNSLSFCSADPNYLASGLDKVRGDHSLVIWDITVALPTLSISPVHSHPNDVGAHPLPNRRTHPQIPRIDTGSRTDSRILQQHAQTETVSAVCFLPHTTQLLFAGISHRWLRLFDLRNPVSSTMNVASKVQGLATDPFDPNRVATFGDGVVSLWDSRKLPQPLLTFTEKDASADGVFQRPNAVYSGVEFSSSRRGALATLEKDSSYVRFWDVMSAHTQTLDDGPADESRSRDLSRAGRRSWANLPWPSGSGSQHHTHNSPKESDTQTPLVLSDTRRTKRFTRPLASFALVPSPQIHPLASNVMVVNREGDLELYALHDAPKQAIWSSRGDLAISAGKTCRILEGFHDTPELDQWDGEKPPSLYAYNDTSLSHSRSRDDSGSLSRGRSKPNTTRIGPVIPTPPPSFPPFFGRGDEDGFPALNSATVAPTNLAATRPRKGRGYSPSELKNHDLGQQTKYHGGGGGVPNATETLREGGKRIYEVGGEGNHRVVSRNHSATRGRRSLGLKMASHVVEDDISMVMRKRAMRGYGLSKPQSNIFITQGDHDVSHGISSMLSDLWAWIYHAHEILCVPTSILHGYDFSYQGLLGIWEGFSPLPSSNTLPEPGPPNTYLEPPSYNHERRSSRRSYSPTNETFHAALAILTTRRPSDRSWKPPVPTSKGLQRQIALQLCGWSLRDDELANAIKKWEKDGEITRAACWLIFMKQYNKATDLLMRSGDEAHRMMSGTVAALIPYSPGSKSPELRDHCERLIVRLQDPYSRAMLTHLALSDWNDVLEEEALPFRERLAIAFQFLDDKGVTSYLHRCIDRSSMRGDIDGIIVSGLSNKAGLDILQGYVDRTGDVQSAAIMGSYVCPPGNGGNTSLGAAGEMRVQRWVESYRDLLDGFKMFHCRVGFDIERGQVMLSDGNGIGAGGGDWVPKQILIRCNYCNKPVGAGAAGDATGVQKGKPTACPHCNRALPRCSICMMTLSIIQDAAREIELLHSQYKDTTDDAIIICQTCRHGGHAAHILDWFYGEDGTRSHGVCAVADCNCRCAEEM